MKLISVITVSFNAEKTIAEAIRSVARQSYQNIEHLVIDGASRDGTVMVVKAEASSSTRIISEPDRGIYDAMNKGIHFATGDVIGFLNADDVFAHSKVIEEVAKIFSSPLVDACFADLCYVEQNDLSKILRYWRAGPLASIGVGWVPPHPTFYVRRDVLLRSGGFDTNVHLAADHELLTRLFMRHRIRCIYRRKVWVHMRAGGATNKSLWNIFCQNLEIIQNLMRLHCGPSLMYPVYKILDRWRQRFRARGDYK